MSNTELILVTVGAILSALGCGALLLKRAGVLGKTAAHEVERESEIAAKQAARLAREIAKITADLEKAGQGVFTVEVIGKEILKRLSTGPWKDSTMSTALEFLGKAMERGGPFFEDGPRILARIEKLLAEFPTSSELLGLRENIAKGLAMLAHHIAKPSVELMRKLAPEVGTAVNKMRYKSSEVERARLLHQQLEGLLGYINWLNAHVTDIARHQVLGTILDIKTVVRVRILALSKDLVPEGEVEIAILSLVKKVTS